MVPLNLDGECHALQMTSRIDLIYVDLDGSSTPQISVQTCYSAVILHATVILLHLKHKDTNYLHRASARERQ